jgi:hypothetical protein
MSTKERAPAGADTTTPYFTVGKPVDTQWMDPTGNYAGAMKTNQDEYTRYMASMEQSAIQAASAAQQVPAYAAQNYNPVSYNAQAPYASSDPYSQQRFTPMQAYGATQYNPAAAYQNTQYARENPYQAVQYDPRASMNQFMGNANQLSDLVSGQQSALNSSLNQLAAYNARQSGEAALAAMPGLRNSGAAAAAFGEAYGNEYTKALAQQQQNQLNLTGNLWNQSMANASAEQQTAGQLAAEQGMYGYGQQVGQGQFGAQLASQESQFGYGQNVQQQQYKAGLAAQEGQFGYGQQAAQRLASAQLAAQESQFGYNAAEEQRQYAYNQAVQQGQFGAQFASGERQYAAGLQEQQAQYQAMLQQQAIQNQLSNYQNMAQLYGSYGQANMANYSNMAANQGWVFNPTYEANQYYGMPGGAAPTSTEPTQSGAPAPTAPTTAPVSESTNPEADAALDRRRAQAVAEARRRAAANAEARRQAAMYESDLRAAAALEEQRRRVQTPGLPYTSTML